LLQVLQGSDQGKVLDDIGMVAGVECVSVTEHALMVTPQPLKCQKTLAKQQFSRLESRASQRFSDPAAEGYQLFMKANPT
jgi:propanediol dehydratase small subunit